MGKIEEYFQPEAEKMNKLSLFGLKKLKPRGR